MLLDTTAVHCCDQEALGWVGFLGGILACRAAAHHRQLVRDCSTLQQGGRAGGMSGDTPVCLISQQGEQLRVHEDGLALLDSLGSAPLATLAVAGNYRTGKSFFLNQLVGARNTVGSTTESCTRGIWAWVAPPEVWSSAAEPNARLLVLDTEGLASIDQDETYDAKVFSLGILLSSFFIYNSMGVIDESAVDRLFLVGELTKNVCLSSDHAAAAGESPPRDSDNGAEGRAEELASFFPPFLWLLRDFHLDLEKDGEAIGLAEYLETALEDRPGSSSRVKENNRIRRSFKSLFRDRTCATLVRPVNEEAQLKQLPTLSEADLRPQFVTEMAAIRSDTLRAVKTKQLFGKTVSAPMLATLARSYVDAINGGAVPDIRKSWDYVVEETLRTAYESAAQILVDELRSAAVTTPLPSRASLDSTYRTLVDTCKTTFVSMCGSTIESSESKHYCPLLQPAFPPGDAPGENSCPLRPMNILMLFFARWGCWDMQLRQKHGVRSSTALRQRLGPLRS